MRVYVLALLLVAGCKKKSDSRDEAIAQMVLFKDLMCACKDKACADKVQESLTKWSTDFAMRTSETKSSRVDEADMKKMTEVARMYSECMTKATSDVPVAEPAVPAPQVPVPPVPQAGTVDDVVRVARAWLSAEYPGRIIRRVKYGYVDAEGKLDPTHGTLEVETGRIDERNAKRRLGTPVTPTAAHDDCLTLLMANGSWTNVPRSCAEAIDYTPRCTVATIWKRAIEREANADAVAVIELDVPSKTWAFGIDDEPANVHFSERFPDDCELKVESAP